MQTQLQPEELLPHMPGAVKWERALRELHLAWRSIESTARMVCPVEARTILPTVRATRDGFSRLENELITNLVRENAAKCVREMRFKASVIIDIVVRNLFERTADVGFLAMDQAVRDFVLDEARDAGQIWNRLREYRDKYTVYDEILILDTEGRILAHLDTGTPLVRSDDPLIAQTLASDSYVETFRKSDLRPSEDENLIYSRKITHPQSGQPIGVLCLCFPLGVEMAGVFAGLRESGDRSVMLMLDRDGRVIASSDEEHVRKGARVPLALTGDYEVISFAGRDYFAKTCAAQDYQGYGGPGWYGHVMVPCESAFRLQGRGVASDPAQMAGIMTYAESFCPPLHEVVRGAERINDALRRVIWNGQVMCAGENTDMLRLRAVLQEISQASAETGSVFHDSIDDLYTTVLSSSLQSMQSVAALCIDIMDRNLYERANDCRWWALTPDIRALMGEGVLSGKGKARIAQILEDINALYTAYVRLVVFDVHGTIVAASNLHGDALQAAGMTVDEKLLRRTLSLRGTQAYCVSPFEPSALYGDRPTYIYCAAIRHPQDVSRVVGGIGIVFDAEPEFRNMLLAGLPERPGAFAVFVDRAGRVISGTRAELPPGSVFRIDELQPDLAKGAKEGRIVVHEGQYMMVGRAASSGYREYKNSGDYENDVMALVAVPVGPVVMEASSGLPLENRNRLRHRAGARQDFATFSIDGHRFALPTETVVEAVCARQLSCSTALKPPLAGLLHFDQGEAHQPLLPVIDMHRVMHAQLRPDQEAPNEIIVVRAGKRLFGLRVSQLGEVLEVGSEEIQSAEGGLHEGALVRQFIQTGERETMIQVLDTACLARLVFG